MPANQQLDASAERALLGYKTPTNPLDVLMAKSYDDLMSAGQLADLKALDESAYNRKVSETKLSHRKFGNRKARFKRL